MVFIKLTLKKNPHCLKGNFNIHTISEMQYDSNFKFIHQNDERIQPGDIFLTIDYLIN